MHLKSKICIFLFVVPNPCKNYPCHPSTICLLSSKGRTCHCADGYTSSGAANEVHLENQKFRKFCVCVCVCVMGDSGGLKVV